LQGTTPLHWAAYEGHMDMVELLLKSKADVNQENKDVCLLFLFSLSSPFRLFSFLPRLLSLLIQGDQPLTRAINKKHDKIEQLLFDYGAKPNLKVSPLSSTSLASSSILP
jgi:ankyrin repeat protein